MKREFAENTFRMKSLAAAVGLLSGGVHAADFTVTTLSDSGDGSLRWAIDQAESTEGQDSITFASSLSGAINLQSPLPMITEGLSITGPGITLNAEGISVPYSVPPVINIYTQIPYQTFSLAGMTIRGSDSGAVRADLYYGRYSSVALSDMVVTGNTVRSAIDVNYGNLTIADSVISGNSANRDGAGVSFSDGELSITDSEISNNTTVEGDDGAGISVRDGQFNITDSKISNNTTIYGGNGGGLSLRYSEGVIERSSITGNTAAGSGGGIAMGGTRLTVVNSSVDDNSAEGNGGGIFSASFYGRLEVQSSSISGNQAGTGQSYGGEYQYGTGGAITMFGFPPATSLTLGSSIISGNSAISAGAINHNGRFTVYGSKISDNSAVYDGALDISVTGGVIFGSTISGNSAENGSVGIIDVERSYGFYGPRIAEPLAFGPYGGFTIDSTTISGNTLTGDGEGVTLAAYISRNASLTIENSTISNNPSAGPVLDVYSDARYTSFTMRNSTMSGNSASASQSVMVVENISDVELVNNTFVDNNATLPSSVSGETAQVSLHNGLYYSYTGGPYGPYISGQMNVNVSGNAMTSGNDKEMLVGGARPSSNPEYISDNDPVAVVLTSNIMEKGVTIDANSTNDGDEPSMVDPMLGALSMQGGFTAVHMPLAGSPVIDGGDSAFRAANRDQRGLQGAINNFDIGSVEVTSNTAPKLTVNLPARIGGVVGKEIPVIALADLYSDAEGDTVIVDEVHGLPAGLTWDGTSISGTLERAGTYLVTVIARDDREDSLEAITQVEVVVKEKASAVPFVEDDDDDDFLGSVPLGGLALLGFLAALRRRRQ